MHESDVVTRLSGREDFHQSVGYAKVMESIGWVSLPLSGSRIAVRPLGIASLAKMQRPKIIDLGAINRIRARLRMIHVIIEPGLSGKIIGMDGKQHAYSFLDQKGFLAAQKIFANARFRVCGERYAHSKTAVIDVADSIEDVIARFPSKTRYNVRLSAKRGVLYTSTPFQSLSQREVEEFLSMHSQWSKEKKVTGYSDAFLRIMIQSFPKNGWMIQARKDALLHGAMMVLLHDRVGYYFYTCSTPVGRDNHVPTGMLTHAVRLTKENGGDIFDFCSVYDERYPGDHPRWKGFSTFKDRFAPTPIYYPLSFDRWIY